jgi:hypothetical protein
LSEAAARQALEDALLGIGGEEFIDYLDENTDERSYSEAKNLATEFTARVLGEFAPTAPEKQALQDFAMMAFLEDPDGRKLFPSALAALPIAAKLARNGIASSGTVAAINRLSALLAGHDVRSHLADPNLR